MQINETRIDKICIERGMKKLSISTNPTWIDKNRQEGIEFIIVLNRIKTFWMKDGQRIYNEPSGGYMTNTLELINTEKEGNKKEPENLPTENNGNAQLPEFLTPALMTKWAQMSTTDRVLMFQQTPKDKIEHVNVGKNDNGEIIYAPYVKGNYMFREANAAFLFDWYLDVKTITVVATGVSVVGTLYGWFKEYNKYLSRPATGYQELNKKVDTELAKKGATTDAIKKGLSLFGFNSDVYSGERE